VDAIYCVIDKGLYISPEVKEALRRRREANVQGSENEQELALSERETHMLKLICQQKTSGEIAAILGLSERTVHAHRKRIQLKTKSRNVAGLVLYAVKHNILTENEIFTTL
jgi:DNA-binding CsgD family transcriptional regulator